MMMLCTLLGCGVYIYIPEEAAETCFWVLKSRCPPPDLTHFPSQHIPKDFPVILSLPSLSPFLYVFITFSFTSFPSILSLSLWVFPYLHSAFFKVADMAQQKHFPIVTTSDER